MDIEIWSIKKPDSKNYEPSLMNLFVVVFLDFPFRETERVIIRHEQQQHQEVFFLQGILTMHHLQLRYKKHPEQNQTG